MAPFCIFSLEGVLLCGWLTARLNSVTDSAWVNTNSIIWTTVADNSYVGEMHLFPFTHRLSEHQPQQYHSCLHRECLIYMIVKRYT